MAAAGLCVFIACTALIRINLLFGTEAPTLITIQAAAYFAAVILAWYVRFRIELLASCPKTHPT